MSAANLAPEFFASDNLMPKDVSQWDLFLVKEELWDHVPYEGKVQNTVILAEISIRIFEDFRSMAYRLSHFPVISTELNCSLNCFLQNETSLSSNGRVIREKISKY